MFPAPATDRSRSDQIPPGGLKVGLVR